MNKREPGTVDNGKDILKGCKELNVGGWLTLLTYTKQLTNTDSGSGDESVTDIINRYSCKYNTEDSTMVPLSYTENNPSSLPERNA